MKIHLIFEHHEHDHEKRERFVIPYLYQKGYIIASEGHHNLVFMRNRYGLEDILYQMYVEVAMSYLSACEGNIQGVHSALEEIQKMYSLKDRNDALNFEITAYTNNLEEVVNVKPNVLAILEKLISSVDQHRIDFMKTSYGLLTELREIVVAYTENVKYLKMPAYVASLYISQLPSLDLTQFLNFLSWEQAERLKFGDIILKELRDVAITWNIYQLILQNESKDNKIAIIIGGSHGATKFFQNRMLNLCTEHSYTISFYNGYDDLCEELGITYPMKREPSFFGKHREVEEEPLKDDFDIILRGSSLS